uniref:Immunoglobulin V-set domain-containing protein n=1 Tax=Dicentrarchus labrax TaxID=13489 RepID=A0A8P4K5J3_DICLA
MCEWCDGGDTQKPLVGTLRKGETATMDCNPGTVTNTYAHWYKQIPGGVPQYVLRFCHGHSSPCHGSGFSSPKFTSTHQSQSDHRLIINNVEEETQQSITVKHGTALSVSSDHSDLHCDKNLLTEHFCFLSLLTHLYWE